MAAAGAAFTAIDKSFPVTVTGSSITIQFTTGSADLPKISAIEIKAGTGIGIQARLALRRLPRRVSNLQQRLRARPTLASPGPTARRSERLSHLERQPVSTPHRRQSPQRRQCTSPLPAWQTLRKLPALRYLSFPRSARSSYIPAVRLIRTRS
ncbi:MAG: hypothetical protein DMG70_05035 [Acidobacteria bacterium]|nr:MAG: hypothetical protein DMG70_05035 [Acidobacteriota bacterium]